MTDATPPDRTTPGRTARRHDYPKPEMPRPADEDSDEPASGDEERKGTALALDRYTDRALDVHRPAWTYFTPEGARVCADSDLPVFPHPAVEIRRMEIILWLGAMGVPQQVAEQVTRKGGFHSLRQEELAGLIPECIDELVEGLRHLSEPVRQCAALLLSYAHGHAGRVVPALARTQAEDASARVRAAAAKALSRIRSAP